MSRLRVAAVVALALLAPRAAAADDGPDAALAYTTTAFELGVGGVLAGNFSHTWSSDGPGIALNFTPLVLGAGAGLAAHYGDLDARPALALHGAMWMGLEGFLLGALIDGRDHAWHLRAGAFAWSLGAAGAIVGGLFGATQVDHRSEQGAWLAAPGPGFVSGGLILGGALVLIGGADGDDAPGQLATGAVVGLAVGLGIATYYAMRGHEGAATTPRVQSGITGPVLSDGRATIISIGGAF